ncbi:hypothetical protein KEF29_34770 [Streptomyces tuirus]|uniref:Uncharacterized protein n=1 Tax=Streptomyces tuirus TaxID=68278 RepID=A0A941J5L1_9ACTN|nr:hypothetical protein [Streptomyces tuirus]
MVCQRTLRVAAQLRDEAQLGQDQGVRPVETDLAVPFQDRAHPGLRLVEEPLATRAETEPQLRVDLARTEAEFGGEAPGPLVVLPSPADVAGEQRRPPEPGEQVRGLGGQAELLGGVQPALPQPGRPLVVAVDLGDRRERVHRPQLPARVPDFPEELRAAPSVLLRTGQIAP